LPGAVVVLDRPQPPLRTRQPNRSAGDAKDGCGRFCILPLPTPAELSPRLAPLGFTRAQGARPDSPGVYRDIPRGDELVAQEVWEKRLYFARERSAILHIRRTDSPWGRYTVWFRDWLRAHPVDRQEYERTKRKLSAQNLGKPDYDDYTRARTEFFDRVQPAFTEWVKSNSV
jgi:GrpB-like predicted nucleotidyltransferase (UPF0157 family)